ncbi:MAG: bifunctional DNA-formamidopyrimidine glycosylase/DNA-(apurinic or apyrimidinic site) lyase [Spirochaetes bacterium]|nr:bifunctional DNA-formamidopyrimidine glycosylase/DNA-(apurinic or apyrimidinic site) lyase [Spirochaetota bacterium]
MPELPEVETIARDLNQFLRGKVVQNVNVLHTKPLSNCNESEFIQFCQQEKFKNITRAGKYLFFEFESEKKMILHLRMTGKFQFFSPYDPEVNFEKHQRLLFLLKNQEALAFHDVRIFGTVSIYYPHTNILEYKKIGPEPFSSELNPAILKEQAKNRKVPIKNLLLDQKFIAGIGNIYACEILHAIGIHPAKPSSSLNLEEWQKVLTKTREILKEAIRARGTTINDYRGLAEKKGSYQKHLKVYNQENQSCPTCKTTKIIRIKQAQRSTFFCPACQPE